MAPRRKSRCQILPENKFWRQNDASGNSEPLNNRRIRHPARLAHGLQAVARAAGFHRIQHRRHQSCTGGAKRMAEGNGATAGIQARRISVELALPGQRLALRPANHVRSGRDGECDDG